MVYLVDGHDRVLGAVERKEAHQKMLLHRAGIVFLSRSDGSILIQHRSLSKETFPGRYDASVSFHVTYGESYADAAARELGEETGISAPVSYAGKFTHHDPPEHEVVAVFHCTSDEEVRIDLAESEGFEFLDDAKIDSLIASGNVTPWLREGWRAARPSAKRRRD